MDGEAFRVPAHLVGSSPAAPCFYYYPSATAENPNQSNHCSLFDAGSAPLQLQLFGNAATEHESFTVSNTPPVNAVPPAVAPAAYCGNNYFSLTNQAGSASIGRGDEKQQLLKLQMSLNNCRHGEEAAHVGNPSAVSTGLRLSYEDDERNSSVTSGSGSMSSLPTAMSFADDLMAQMDKENKEISNYLRLQAEQIGKEMKEVNQRQLISLMASLERAVGKKLREKELEAEAMNRKSKELNEQIKKVAMEVQSWQSAALYNQSIANNLKSRLMQVVAQNSNLTREGSGDSEEANTVSSHNVNATPGGFFQSRVLGSKNTTVGLGACRLCRGKEASVLVMPCRHLCLCLDCERNADVCPVCRFAKTGSVEINMS